MDKSFDPKDIESRWYPQWEASGYFAPQGDGAPYTIMLPPPNVTGTLHMGHAFQHTIMDTLIRYQRMCGRRTLWQLGTDHAGIATEMVVSRLLEREGQTRNALGREQFVERVWRWKEESGSTISRQMRRMGVSGDWSRERFTMDEGLSQAVVETFVRLHEQGLIYRGQRLVNWDPVLLTAISDLEVVSEEENGKLWSIAYPLADGSGQLIVATTRPETMLGDVAVAVNPEDERYTHLIGKRLKLPLTDREIPIIADAYVDKDFGTGCVKITPAHDFNDYEIGKRHSLPMINIFTPTATVNDNAPAKYRGLDRYVARKAVLADLTAAELLVEEKAHKLQVPRGDRTGQVIEPYLTYQWFVKMDGLAARGLELVENGSVKFVPENWINTYRHWLGNIQDWCISRQLWWGHRIPAWYDDAGNVYVARDEEEALAKAKAARDSVRPEPVEGRSLEAESARTSTGSVRTDSGSEIRLTRDDDVLETWFSSALWSHSTLGWPNPQAMQQYGFDTYLPTSVLVTGFDIIFFWVARMIMMTDHFTGKVPFEHVYITGLVRDKDGNKMSKSKGNILDPLDLIDGITLDDLVAKRTGGLMQPQMAEKIEKATRKEFPNGITAVGADALRFTFASLASHGRDIKFDFNRCEGYKNFCNKLWNAARFVLMNTEQFAVRPEPVEGRAANADTERASTSSARTVPAPTAKTEPERWILSRLATTISEVHKQLADYRFDLASQALYEFTWNEYCDWFLELAKPALGGDDAEAANSTRHTLLYVLESVLRALHPLIPFVTEEIWQHVAPKLGIAAGQFLATQHYPQAADIAVDPTAAAEVQWLKDVLMGVRRIRGEMNIAPSKAIPMLFAGGEGDDARRVAKFSAQIAFLARAEGPRFLAAGEAEPAAAAAIVGSLRVLIPLAGLIDLDAEKKRLDREIARVEGEIKKCQSKLASETFVANAPAAVVEQERARLADWTVQLDGLRSQRAKLG
jgi:valyl-tRNA synthetase